MYKKNNQPTLKIILKSQDQEDRSARLHASTKEFSLILCGLSKAGGLCRVGWLFGNRAVLFWSTAAWQDVFQTLSRCLWRNVISHPGAQYLHCSPLIRFIMPDLSAPTIWKGEKRKTRLNKLNFWPRSYVSELGSKRGWCGPKKMQGP